MSAISLFVNGETVELNEPVTAAELLTLLEIQPKGIAIALNAEILPRSEWGSHQIGKGDRIEIVSAAAGG